MPILVNFLFCCNFFLNLIWQNKMVVVVVISFTLKFIWNRNGLSCTRQINVFMLGALVLCVGMEVT